MKRIQIFFLFFFLLQAGLFAQPFQNLYAYDNGPGTNIEAGSFADIVCLEVLGPNDINVVTIGTNLNSAQDGLVGFHQADGTPISFVEFVNPNANDVVAEAIAETPLSDVVACFFDPSSNASDIVRMTNGGAVLWTTRLEGFHVKGVDVGVAGGAERIWLTGQSTTNNFIALQSLSATGTQLFAKEYLINAPASAYTASEGQKISFNAATNIITMVGSAEVDGAVPTAAIMIRTNPAGVFIVGRAYQDPAGNDFYRAKDLVIDPIVAPFNFVALEFSSNGQPREHTAAMHIDAVGGVIWAFEYPDVGPFLGTDYQTEGLVTDGNRLLTCGSYLPTGKTDPSSYSLSIDFAGPALFMNDYVTLSAYPEVSSGLHGMDFNNLNGFHYMAGDFNSVTDAGNWPNGSDPNSFWMVASAPIGASTCSQGLLVSELMLNPSVPFLNQMEFDILGQVASPLVSEVVKDTVADQCATAKRIADLEKENENLFSANYLSESAQIQINLPSQLDRPGVIRVYDMQGRTLMEIAASPGSTTIDANGLGQGIYLLAFEKPGLKYEVKKLMIQR